MFPRIIAATAFAFVAVAPFASSAAQAFWVYCGQYAYLDGVRAQTNDQVTAFAEPLGVNAVFQDMNALTVAALPPKGYQLRKDEKQWTLCRWMEVNNHSTTNGPTEYGRFPSNPGYTVTITNSSKSAESSFAQNAAGLSDVNMVLAPCFQLIRYDLVYNGNCDSYPGDYFGSDAWNRNVIYTNTVAMATPTWDRSPYYTLAGFSANSAATAADFAVGEVVPDAGEALGVVASGILTNPVVRLYAVWEPRHFTVTLDPNGGDPVSPASFTITGEDTCPELPVPERFGFTPDGWFLEDGVSSDFGTAVYQGYDFAGDGDRSIYAKWTPVVREISLDPAGGSVASNTLWVSGAEHYADGPLC
jgi:hypothetical protein